MPLIKVYIPVGRTKAQKRDLIDAIRKTIREILQTPEWDGFVLLNECEMGIDPSLPHDRAYLEIILFPGRKKETKKRLLSELAKEVAKALGIPPTQVLIYITEPPLENWGIRGGQQASEVDLGFCTDL